MTPEELNATNDEVLFPLIDAALDVYSAARDSEPLEVPRLAPFITNAMLLRVHEHVVALGNRGARSIKQKQVALTVGALALVGVPLPGEKWQLEKIGNHLDKMLDSNSRRASGYVAKLKKIRRSGSTLEVKAQKQDALHVACVDIPWWDGSTVIVPDTADRTPGRVAKQRELRAENNRLHAAAAGAEQAERRRAEAAARAADEERIAGEAKERTKAALEQVEHVKREAAEAARKRQGELHETWVSMGGYSYIITRAHS